ncbi:MAG: hypothetical protein ABL903_01195 [Methylococcales bacterium]
MKNWRYAAFPAASIPKSAGTSALSGQKAAAKNHLHALTATQEPPKAVLRDAKLGTSQLEKRIASLKTEAVVWIEKHPELKRVMEFLVGIKGIAQTRAIALMGELLLLPPTVMSTRSYTATNVWALPPPSLKTLWRSIRLKIVN